MKAIARKVAGWCLSDDVTNETELEVVAYGLELILGTLLKYVVLLGIGQLINKGMEVAVILFLIAVFRIFAGGVHGKTSLGCFLYMLMVCVVSVMLSQLSLGLDYLIQGLGYAVCFYVVYQYVPLQSLKNPVCDTHIIKRKKLGAFLVVSGSSILAIAAGEGMKWIFLYPMIIECTAIVLASKKRRRLS